MGSGHWVRNRLLEIVLSEDSSDVCSGDVPSEIVLSLSSDPSFEDILLTVEEQEEWDRFRAKHGNGPAQIGEFAYGSAANPWA